LRVSHQVRNHTSRIASRTWDPGGAYTQGRTLFPVHVNLSNLSYYFRCCLGQNGFSQAAEEREREGDASGCMRRHQAFATVS
jgi:hypothetical protein